MSIYIQKLTGVNLWEQSSGDFFSRTKIQMNIFLDNAKIKARQRLNSLPPKEAQEIVNRVLGADEFVPDLSHEIDWDEISTFKFDSNPMVKKTLQEILTVLSKIPAISETVMSFVPFAFVLEQPSDAIRSIEPTKQ